MKTLKELILRDGKYIQAHGDYQAKTELRILDVDYVYTHETNKCFIKTTKDLIKHYREIKEEDIIY